MSPPSFPEIGFVRLPEVLRHIPVSRSAWWAGIQEGRFPAPVKLGPRTTAWRAEDIRALIDQLGRAGQGS
jgi:prophage regulatory protein